VTWGYRQGLQPPEFYLKQMGLWDLDDRLDRIATPLVDQFRTLTHDVGSVGPLSSPAIAASVH
jgi:hypothetical protein